MALVPYFVIIPLGAAFLIPLLGRRVKASAEILASLGTLSLGIISFLVAPMVAGHKALVYKIGNWMPPIGVPFVIDSLSAFMLLTVNVVAFLIAVYSIEYIKKFTDTWKFYSLFMIMVAGINGVLIAGDIFNMYVFLEIAAIAGYFLVAFGTRAEEIEASFKYAVMGSVASIFILLGIALIYSYASTLNLADLASVIAAKGSLKILHFVMVLFFMGFGLKAALVPFHSWLPYAHSAAPAPISAMLSGISIKVLGVYALARIFFNVFGMDPAVSNILITLAVLSMVVASLLAFGQSDMKRLFAYSSISQIGYIALGLGIATPLSIFAALFHLFNHSIFKSLLFLNSGTIEQSMGTRDLNKMSGIIAKEPVAGYTAVIGMFSICGIPPFGGFWSKLLIIIACIQAGHPVLGFIAIAVSVLTMGYYFRALTSAFFRSDDKNDKPPAGKRTPFAMAFPVVILAVLSIASVYMIVPGTWANTLLKDAATALGGGRDYINTFVGALR